MKKQNEISMSDNAVGRKRSAHGLDTRAEFNSRTNTIIIGAGQAGLSVGYHLAKHNIPFLILDANHRVGDSWRSRWDSLRLFTPARYDGLDGMPFPAQPHYFPTKNEMADYLENYARQFELPVLTGIKVERLTMQDGQFVVTANGQWFEADNVVVAMANYQQPRVPPFADQLDSSIVQIHSSEYRNLSQLRPGPVLIVGAGNSGSEIAIEAAKAHKVWMSGRDTGHLPFRIAGTAARLFLVPLVLKFVFHRLMTIETPIGRKVRPKIISIGGPLIRVMPADLKAASIERVPRTVGVRNGRPILADGSLPEVSNVIWCTGYHPGFSWIDLPVFQDHEPKHRAGVAPDVPGLYFVGLHFLYALSSTMIHGVGRDAQRIANAIELRVKK